MRLWLLLVLALNGCQSAPEPRPTEAPPQYWQDAHFNDKPQLLSPDALFEVTDEMAALLQGIRPVRNKNERLNQLIEWLFERNTLPIRYNAEMTVAPKEVMVYRQGNCLSLSVFTAIMARHWELEAQLQRVSIPPRWSRSGDLITLSQHVNIRVKTGEMGANVLADAAYRIVDFQRGYGRYAFRTKPISDEVAASFFYHNIAANWLIEGKLDQSYWAVKKALELAPGEMDSWNLLGLVYRRKGLMKEAESVYRYVIGIDNKDPSVWQNLAVLYNLEGRQQEANDAKHRADALMPENPFDYIDQGEQALAVAQVAKAKALFERALRIDDINEEALWGMAKAYRRLGQDDLARKMIDRAIALASTPDMERQMRQWQQANL
ncbi:tetratricopeptide repeat protein [Gallaecimonas xiamenensis]|uniref:Uncharacterized protein n=1 Tax=Gallaecimonas xiamenensis 3-C-1 TaxID=745411 RepID=K2J062_9GAMM|nr:tetratricopeptide repeat protein [Gallaecimonas xiamenensis]EKE76246.1 hypothetical protein B3C1_05040 [Gallaecimonas xiamenensis 3-C-1]